MDINVDGKIITYSKKFCKFVEKNLLKYLDIKYSFLFKKILLFDEWAFLTSG